MMSGVPASVSQAASLLTNPLLTTHSSQTVFTLRALLQANIVVLLPITGEICLNLKLSPFSLPPKPILASCVASGITWAEWNKALGGKPFELLITNAGVRMTVDVNGRPLSLFHKAEATSKSTTPFAPQAQREAPIAKRSVMYSTAAPTAVRAPASAFVRKAPTSKLAQSFSPFDDSDTSDTESDISRPSSRLSTFSFESNSDSGSVTSASSFGSFASMKSKEPSAAFSQAIAPPVVNFAHKATTSYLYEGGSTRVMTGGVMLGGVAKPTPTPATTKKATDAKSWRRAF